MNPILSLLVDKLKSAAIDECFLVNPDQTDDINKFKSIAKENATMGKITAIVMNIGQSTARIGPVDFKYLPYVVDVYEINVGGENYVLNFYAKNIYYKN
jgi:ABC-type branched-subunit amino acid transport system substrate-binding protein